MPFIDAIDRPLLWAVNDAGVLVDAGVTPVGNTTVTGLTLVSDADENALLGAMVDAEIDVPVLPDGDLEAGEIYAYNDTLVMVRQSHTRLDSHPAPTDVTMLALFLVYQENADEALLWVAGEQVYVGTRRLHEDVLYAAIQQHVTQAGWEPGTIGGASLWQVVPTTDEWQAGVAYAVNDEVTYQGTLYRCLQGHTSQVGWEPPAVPALWAVV